VTNDILPDDVLLEIFDFLVIEYGLEAEKWWRTLVHVCRKWRNVVFGSSHRLDLRLICENWRPVREMLDVWPPLPIVIHHFPGPNSAGDNIIAALERNDRVYRIILGNLDQKVLDAMQEPFPALTRLELSSYIAIAPIVPDSFMGGYAPRLQDLKSDLVPIPGLPKLLLSATDLVRLDLRRVPHSGYISPEAIVTCLSTLPRLEVLSLGFESPLSRPNSERRRPPPPTRSVLPALIKLNFKGVSEYLEDLVARIDSPLLDRLEISLFHQLIFDTPQLIQFIGRTPTLEVQDQACLYFSRSHVSVEFPKTPYFLDFSNYHLSLKILCRQPDWQVSSMAQICTSFFPRSFIHMVERLVIGGGHHSRLDWEDGIDDGQWLELLHPFTAVKNLYLSKEFAPRIAPYLQELVGRRTTEVFPTLQDIILDELHPPKPVEEAFEKFIAARQLSNHPVTIYGKIGYRRRKSQNIK
jgi:F-box-like